MREFGILILRLYQQGKDVGGAFRENGNGNERTAAAALCSRKGRLPVPLAPGNGSTFCEGGLVNPQMMPQHLGPLRNARTRGAGPERGQITTILHCASMEKHQSTGRIDGRWGAAELALASKSGMERMSNTYIGEEGVGPESSS